jgi:hypothetical protein
MEEAAEEPAEMPVPPGMGGGATGSAEAFSAEAADAPEFDDAEEESLAADGEAAPEADAGADELAPPPSPDVADIVESPEAAESAPGDAEQPSAQETGQLLLIVGAMMLVLTGLANLIVRFVRRRRTA